MYKTFSSSFPQFVYAYREFGGVLDAPETLPENLREGETPAGAAMECARGKWGEWAEQWEYDEDIVSLVS